MADKTGSVVRRVVEYAQHGFGNVQAYEVDCSDIDALATGDYDLISVPAKNVVLSARVIVLTAAASSGSATVTFKLGSTSLSSAIAKATLAVGEVFNFNGGATGLAAGGGTSAVNFSMTVETAALTALRFLVVLETADVTELL